MFNINRALENDRLLRALTGLNRKAFNELCQVFSQAYCEWVEKDSKPRQRAKGKRIITQAKRSDIRVKTSLGVLAKSE